MGTENKVQERRDRDAEIERLAEKIYVYHGEAEADDAFRFAVDFIEYRDQWRKDREAGE